MGDIIVDRWGWELGVGSHMQLGGGWEVGGRWAVRCAGCGMRDAGCDWDEVGGGRWEVP